MVAGVVEPAGGVSGLVSWRKKRGGCGSCASPLNRSSTNSTRRVTAARGSMRSDAGASSI
jgi:hypothetical protein